MKNNPTKIKKGQRLSPETEFKKGNKPWNDGVTGYSTSMRGEKRPDVTGENNGSWKGDDVGYHGLHKWVHRHKTKPVECEFCGRKDNIQWANKSGEYKRDLDDWIALCLSCHSKYDETTKNRQRDELGRFI